MIQDGLPLEEKESDASSHLLTLKLSLKTLSQLDVGLKSRLTTEPLLVLLALLAKTAFTLIEILLKFVLLATITTEPLSDASLAQLSSHAITGRPQLLVVLGTTH